jgi:hypothetical protein
MYSPHRTNLHWQVRATALRGMYESFKLMPVDIGNKYNLLTKKNVIIETKHKIMVDRTYKVTIKLFTIYLPITSL